MKKFGTLLVALALLLTTSCGMRNAAELAQQDQSVSLRWRQPIAMETVPKESSLTFWREDKIRLTGAYRTAESTVLLYSGDAALVYGKPCLYGEVPSCLDQRGCMISTALAHQLFGSEEVVGLAVDGLEQQYIVRGVFQDEQQLALLPQTDFAFTAAELMETAEGRDNPEDWIGQQLRKDALPQPDWVLYPRDLAQMTAFLAWLPLLFGGLLLLVAVLKAVRNWPQPVRDGALFLLLFSAAVALPFVLSHWPQWLIPSQWSDFSWWGKAWEQLCSRGMNWLTVYPSGRDVFVKIGALKQIIFTAAQCVLCQILWLRLYKRFIERAGKDA